MRVSDARFMVSVMVITAMLSGCMGGYARGPYKPGSLERDVVKAEALYQEARAHRLHDPEQAEALLRDALTADLYHGAAHNDLGVILLQQNMLYEAATEFEWARKLMPGHPDPRVNLAIALKRGYKYDHALASARTALEVRPGHLPAHQAIALIQCRSGQFDEQTSTHLAAIIDHSDDERWRNWAETWMLKMEGRFRN